MENLIQVLKEKSDKHLYKKGKHEEALEVLEIEYNSLDADSHAKRGRVGEKLLATHKGIEYHTGSSKTYLKVIAMLEEKELV